MDCEDIRKKLQDLLDGALGQQEGLGVEGHLKTCVPCSQEYKKFELIAAAIASLPYYSPTAAFSGKVLAALGLAKQEDRLPDWSKWAIGAFGSLVSLWAACIAILIGSRLSLWTAIDAFRLLANPSQLPTLIKFYLAKSALMLGDSVAAANTLADLIGSQAAGQLPVQMAVASVIAAVFMAVVSKRAPTGATTRKWRTI